MENKHTVEWLTNAAVYFKLQQPDATTRWQAEQHQEREKACRGALAIIDAKARPLSEWHEDMGPVVWWRLCRDERPDEASWIGTPLDDDWPGYHTHFTPHPPIPTF